jgi:hypothetical protein
MTQGALPLALYEPGPHVCAMTPQGRSADNAASISSSDRQEPPQSCKRGSWDTPAVTELGTSLVRANADRDSLCKQAQGHEVTSENSLRASQAQHTANSCCFLACITWREATLTTDLKRKRSRKASSA